MHHTLPPAPPPSLPTATTPASAPDAAPPALPPLPQGLETMAQRYAAMARAEAERLIDAEVTIAVREWRVADATFWQRVKYRSRMIRAADTHRRSAAGRA